MTVLSSFKTLVDIRNSVEWAGGYLDGAIHVPVASLLKIGPLLTTPFLIYCKSGVRSHCASDLLSQQGIDCDWLRGGIAGVPPDLVRKPANQDIPEYTDSDGFVKQGIEWSAELANKLAQHDNLVLAPEHWLILKLIREDYETAGIVPNAKMLVKRLAKKYGAAIGNQDYLVHLFHCGPAKRACRIAGLPPPTGCE